MVKVSPLIYLEHLFRSEQQGINLFDMGKSCTWILQVIFLPLSTCKLWPEKPFYDVWILGFSIYMLENNGIMFPFISLREKLHGILVLYFLTDSLYGLG